MTGPRWLGYARVSTDQQARDGTITQQIDLLNRWASDQHLTIEAMYLDDGVSGTEAWENRHGLGEALDTLTTGDTLVVTRLDRLARDLVKQELVMQDIWGKGANVAVVDPTEHDMVACGDNDPTRRLIRQVLGAIAAYERDRISERMQRGRWKKARLGGFTGGHIPWWGTLEDDRIVMSDRGMFALRAIAAGRAEGRSWRDLAADLNTAGIKVTATQAWQHWQRHATLLDQLESAGVTAGLPLSQP